MSSPFSVAHTFGRPSWTLMDTIDGNFSLVNIMGTITEEEVGYGEGGYGEGGYDTPTTNIPGSIAPNWSVVAVK